ncbi:unnamed protein product [Caenorhabditis angaria]|uniref:Uncharacterized protein n=1 Tax=Caenorhabditis angaria TaxID=860376 RepID=A0A9P1IYI7_9PELO|nr:unnamed protein product [Caenorhabditis angaria]
MNLKDCWHTILPIQRNSRRFHQSSTENIMNASTNNQVFPFVGTKVRQIARGKYNHTEEEITLPCTQPCPIKFEAIPTI